MRFLNGLSPGTSPRLAAISMLAFAWLSIDYATSFANTTSQILPAAKNLPTDCSTPSNPISNSDGQACVPGKISTAPSAASTNSIDLETSRHSATDLRSGYALAVPIERRSDSSATSTTFTSASLPITRGSRCGSFSSSDISRTGRLYLAVNLLRNSPIFERHQVNGSKILPIDRRESSFKPPSSEPEIGRTSALLPRQRSSWRRSLRPSIREHPIYARFWMERSYASAWHRPRSKGLTSFNRASLQRSYTNRT